MTDVKAGDAVEAAKDGINRKMVKLGVEMVEGDRYSWLRCGYQDWTMLRRVGCEGEYVESICLDKIQ